MAGVCPLEQGEAGEEYISSASRGNVPGEWGGVCLSAWSHVGRGVWTDCASVGHGVWTPPHRLSSSPALVSQGASGIHATPVPLHTFPSIHGGSDRGRKRDKVT